MAPPRPSPLADDDAAVLLGVAAAVLAPVDVGSGRAAAPTARMCSGFTRASLSLSSVYTTRYVPSGRASSTVALYQAPTPRYRTSTTSLGLKLGVPTPPGAVPYQDAHTGKQKGRQGWGEGRRTSFQKCTRYKRDIERARY